MDGMLHKPLNTFGISAEFLVLERTDVIRKGLFDKKMLA